MTAAREPMQRSEVPVSEKPRAGIRMVKAPDAYTDYAQRPELSAEPQDLSAMVRATLFDVFNKGVDGAVNLLKGARGVAQDHIGPALMSLAKGLILRVEGPVFGAHKIDTKQRDIPQRRKDREK